MNQLNAQEMKRRQMIERAQAEQRRIFTPTPIAVAVRQMNQQIIRERKAHG